MENYTYRVQWSAERREYVAMCLEFPLESARAATAHAAIEGIERTIADIVADYETPPPSLCDRSFSGKFLVRTSPELDARLVVEAAEQGVSLNQWAVRRLAERRPSFGDLF